MRLTARFDVLRQNKEKYEVGVVAKVDFSGEMKRVQFHFPKLPSKFDEWIGVGSERIAQLHTKARMDHRPLKTEKLPSPTMHNNNRPNGKTGTGRARCPTTVDAETIEVGGK